MNQLPLNKNELPLIREMLTKYKQGYISGLIPGSNITFSPSGCRNKIVSSTGSGGIQSLTAGDNITIDDTDPLNPIVSSTGGGGSTTADNGLTETTGNIQLGGDLIGNTEINGDNDTYSIDFKRMNSFSFGAITSSLLSDNNTIGVKTGSGVQNILTAAIRNITATPGQVLTLVDENTGQVEYQNVTGYRGTATLEDGTVTVLTDKVKTGYKIYLSVNTPSGTQGFLSARTDFITDGVSFVINSTSATDDSTVNWWIAP